MRVLIIGAGLGGLTLLHGLRTAGVDAHVYERSPRHGGQPASYDHGDDYASALRKEIRVREPDRLLDRLLVFAIIEARSAERLGLLAAALEDAKSRALYADLATAEIRHRDTFLALARDAAPAAWRARAAELAGVEAALLADRIPTARIH